MPKAVNTIATRQMAEPGLSPPNEYTVGAASFTSSQVLHGQGHSSVHASVTNDTAGSLQVLMAWRSTGPFVQIYQKDTAVDPVTGFSTAEIVCPVIRRYVRVVFTPAAAPPGLGENFELGAYFLPRADSPCFEAAGGSDPVIISNNTVIGNKQVQTVEALPLLAAAASFDGASKDNIDFEAMSASLTVSSTIGTTVVVRFQQRATGADTFRDADVITIPVPAGGAPGPLVNFDRVWSVSRRFGRIQVENTGANPLTTAELCVVQKAIS